MDPNPLRRQTQQICLDCGSIAEHYKKPCWKCSSKNWDCTAPSEQLLSDCTAPSEQLLSDCTIPSQKWGFKQIPPLKNPSKK